MEKNLIPKALEMCYIHMLIKYNIFSLFPCIHTRDFTKCLVMEIWFKVTEIHRRVYEPCISDMTTFVKTKNIVVHYCVCPVLFGPDRKN